MSRLLASVLAVSLVSFIDVHMLEPVSACFMHFVSGVLYDKFQLKKKTNSSIPIFHLHILQVQHPVFHTNASPKNKRAKTVWKTKCSLEVVVVEHKHHARRNKFQIFSKNHILTINAKNTFLLNVVLHKSVLKHHWNTFQKHQKPRVIPRPWARLGEIETEHISQLFACKFQSWNSTCITQSKHSHSTPGVSIHFHTPSCCDVESTLSMQYVWACPEELPQRVLSRPSHQNTYEYCS